MNSLAPASDGVDQPVDCCPRDVAPSQEDGLVQLSSCCWPRADLVKLPLAEQIPKVFDRIQIRAQGRARPSLNVFVSKEVLDEVLPVLVDTSLCTLLVCRPMSVSQDRSSGLTAVLEVDVPIVDAPSDH